MRSIADLAYGLQIICNHFPNARTSVYEGPDQIIIDDEDMDLKYLEGHAFVWHFLQGCGFQWDEACKHLFYLT